LKRLESQWKRILKPPSVFLDSSFTSEERVNLYVWYTGIICEADFGGLGY
jgi:hypothetical protein